AGSTRSPSGVWTRRNAMRVGCSPGAIATSRTRPRTVPEASRTVAPSSSERATRDIAAIPAFVRQLRIAAFAWTWRLLSGYPEGPFETGSQFTKRHALLNRSDMAFLNEHAVWAHGPFYFYVLLTLIDTHITTTCVTLYLHRAQTHRSIKFHPIIEHLMRLWLFLRTAMPTREWVAVHRCHHAYVDREGDPHSPIFFGIWRVVLFGTKLYHDAAHDPEIIEQYGKGTP